MKNLSFKLLTIFFIASLIGCTSNDDSINPNATDYSTNTEEGFLNNYYGVDSYSIKESTTFSTAKHNNMIIKEVSLPDNNKMGIIVLDKNTSHLLYFASIDKVNKTIYVKNFASNKELLFEGNTIEKSNLFSESFSITNSLSPALQATSLSSTPQTTLGRFWGWECSIIHFPSGLCQAECRYFILGNPGAWKSFPCDDLPGRYGKNKKN